MSEPTCPAGMRLDPMSSRPGTSNSTSSSELHRKRQMMSSEAVESSDPLVDVEDKFPLLPAGDSLISVKPAALQLLPVPLGFRFAVHPVRAGRHGKTYTTVTETEDTERSDDGKVYTVPDTVRREEEID